MTREHTRQRTNLKTCKLIIKKSITPLQTDLDFRIIQTHENYTKPKGTHMKTMLKTLALVALIFSPALTQCASLEEVKQNWQTQLNELNEVDSHASKSEFTFDLCAAIRTCDCLLESPDPENLAEAIQRGRPFEFSNQEVANLRDFLIDMRNNLF